MAKSNQKILLCLLAIAGLTKALKIRNGDRCLNCSCYVDVVKGAWTAAPYINDPGRFYPCSAFDNVPNETFWTYMPNSNQKINLCIRDANACLGCSHRIIKIDLVVVMRKSNTNLNRNRSGIMMVRN